MKMISRIPRVSGLIVSFSALVALMSAQVADPSPSDAARSDETLKLEKFIVKESGLAGTSSLLQNSREVDSIFGTSRRLVDTPRSVTVLTQEMLERTGTKDVWDLASVVPGVTTVNYYGVPATPVSRGLLASVFFNGMQRVFNRNGYPVSFGSTEAMDFVRGPATGQYAAALPGGYVNFVPKAPYFDKTRGSVRFSLGQYDEFNVQADIGGPTLLAGKPSAFRLSITNQKASSYYNGYKNDYTSIYGSFKSQLTPNVTIYTGAEYYAFRSNENPGWNRVTQDLIDNDNYIYGSPKNDLTGKVLSLTLPSGAVATFVNDTPGYVNRAALESATPFGGSRGQFGYSFLATNGFASSGFRPALTAANPDATFLYQYMGAINNPTAATKKIKGYQTLSNASDFADADTYLFFFDTVVTPRDNLIITNKVFLDSYERLKISGYGYGEQGRNLSLEDKLQVLQKFPRIFKGIDLIYGGSVRYEDSLARTEFTVEPFNRRDITAAPTPNDILLSGNQRGNTGKTFWDPFGSVWSKVTTGGLFFVPEVRFTNEFSVIFSGRYDNTSYHHGVPFDLAADFNSGDKGTESKSYTNWSVSPSYKLTKNTSIYGTYQKGTAAQGFYVSGSLTADTNFSESTFWEAGIKTQQLDGKFYAAATYYYQKLTNFDVRGGAFYPQHGRGFEIETSYEVSKALTINANASAQEVIADTTGISGGFVPLTAAQQALYAGIFTADFGGRTERKPGSAAAGIPWYTVNAFAKYDLGGGWGVTGGIHVVPEVWGNPDKTFKLPAYTLTNAAIFYSTGRWSFDLAAKNIFSTRYFVPFEGFSANAIILKGEPIHVTFTMKYKF